MSSYIKKTNSDFFVPTEHTGKVLAAGLRFLQDALFCFPMDREGNIVDVKVEGCILSEMRAMLSAIAPWVREGSYLSMFSDDGSRWRWSFQDGKCQEIPAELRWPDASEPSTLPREQDHVVILVEEGKVTDILSSDPRIAGEVIDLDVTDESQRELLLQAWESYRKTYHPIYEQSEGGLHHGCE